MTWEVTAELTADDLANNEAPSWKDNEWDNLPTSIIVTIPKDDSDGYTYMKSTLSGCTGDMLVFDFEAEDDTGDPTVELTTSSALDIIIVNTCGDRFFKLDERKT